MVQWFPPLEGVNVAGWVGTVAVGIALIMQGSTFGTAYGGFMIGFCLLWGWIRWRYESVELQTAIEGVSE